MKRISLIIFIVFIFTVPSFAAEIYYWTDENGIKHAEDRPPPSDKVKFETEKFHRPTAYEIQKMNERVDLKLIESSWKTERHGSRSIVGLVKNNSSRALRYAKIEFSLYDGNDAQVGTAMTNITNLQAGGYWNFEVHILERKAVAAKLVELSGN